jgi:hypothetical protein
MRMTVAIWQRSFRERDGPAYGPCRAHCVQFASVKPGKGASGAEQVYIVGEY